MKLNIKLKVFSASLLAMFVSTLAHAYTNFVVKQVKFEGLGRVTLTTALHETPIKPGDVFTSQSTIQIIHQLYRTGFFEDISVFRRGRNVVIHVHERPTISRITIKGNKLVTTDQLMKSLHGLNLKEGEFYNPSLLDSIRKSLVRQYISRGQYNAKVKAIITNEKRNRVAIDIKITESKIAKVSKISFSGNNVFSDRQLRKQMTLHTSNLLTLMNKRDRFTKEQLDDDVKAITAFYQNKGYLRFAILDVQTHLSNDKRHIEIHISLKEGEQYLLDNWYLTGNLLDYSEPMHKAVMLKNGAPFSRSEVNLNVYLLGQVLGEHGYAMARVVPITDVDEHTKRVTLRLNVIPGSRYYVRHIHFVGNYQTKDIVLRREMRQMEGAMVNSAKVKMSERRLRLLGYIKKVDSKVDKVPGKDDQVDLQFNVLETERSGSVELSGGYGTQDGWFVSTGFKQPNFFGSGNTVSLKAMVQRGQESIAFAFENPYFNDEGVTSGFHISARHTKADQKRIVDFTESVYSVGYYLGIPMSENDKLTVGVNLEHIELKTGEVPNVQIARFISKHGSGGRSDFTSPQIYATWVHNSLDRAIFPTKGLYQSLGAEVAIPVGSDDLPYYKVNYYAHYFKPLFKKFILTLRTTVSYGDGYSDFDELPFFKNFYAGGVATIRGYKAYSLGPRGISPLDGMEDSKAIGGNLLTAASVGLILPSWHEDVRVAVNFDIGNVFNTHADDYVLCKPATGLVYAAKKGTNTTLCPNQMKYPGVTGFDWSDMRTAVGVSIEWRSPMGPLIVSLSKALNHKDGDDLRVFELTMDAGI